LADGGGKGSSGESGMFMVASDGFVVLEIPSKSKVEKSKL
jgi:hypothetical protein